MTKTNNVWGCIFSLLGGCYFFLVLIAPFQHMPLKLSILSIICFMIVCQGAIESRVRIHKNIVFWVLICVISGCFFVLLGIPKAHPKSFLYTVMLYIVFPLVYFPLIVGYSKKNYMINSCKIITYSSFFILLEVTLFFLGAVGIMNFQVELAGSNNASFQNGIAIVKLGVVSTLVYLIPFLIALFLNYRLGVDKIAPKFIVLLSIVAAVIAALLSGRRAVLLMLLIAPFLVLALSLFLPDKRNKLVFYAVRSSLFIIIIVIIGVFILQKILDFNTYGVLERLSMVLGLYGGGFGGGDRNEQIWLFLNDINKAPFFGVGHGVVADVIRDADKPWRYEMSYLSLLFHTGLVGTIVYASAVLWIYFKGVQIIRKGGLDASIMIAMLVGLTSMLISYSTNPYLDAFDALWVIFLPVAYINTHFLEKKM